MLLTITVLGVKWYWILLVAGILVYHFRWPTGEKPKNPELMDTEEFGNYNEARFKTFKKVTSNENDPMGKLMPMTLLKLP